MTVLETPRLVLRHLTPDDAPFILALLNEPAFLRNIGDKGVRTLDQARRYLEDGPIASYATHGFGLWLMVRKATGEPVGMCGLLKRPTLDDVDLGFALPEAAWGHGYATEAATATVAYAWRTLGLTRLVAITNPDNTGSMHVLDKVGFVREGTVRLAGDGPLLTLFTAAP